MKLITCACLFVTLLALSNAYRHRDDDDDDDDDTSHGSWGGNFMAGFDDYMKREMDNMNQQIQKSIQDELVEATGKSPSEIQEMSSNTQLSITCNNGRCIICSNNKCKTCEKGKCSNMHVAN